MKVLLYLKHFPAQGEPLRVGTNKAVHGLASGLAIHGADVTVLCEGARESRRRIAAGYEIRCFRNDARYRSFRLAPGLKAFLDEGIDDRSVIVLNGIFHPSVYAVSRCLRRRGMPYVVAPHGPYHPRLFGNRPQLKWPYWYLLERRMLRHARAIQLLDARQAEWSRRLGVDRPVIEAPNGFFAADVPPVSRLEWRRSGAARLLYWGRLDLPIKGLDLLLGAFGELPGTERATLTIQGPDWTGQQTRVRELIDGLPNAADVCLRPPVFDRPAPSCMLAHDVVCVPSRFEGFGLSALEAMLAGRVLLVTEGVGIAAHVAASDCGVVVRDEVGAIRDGLLALLARRHEWQEMGMRGRRHALERLAWPAIAGAALEQYQRLLH